MIDTLRLIWYNTITFRHKGDRMTKLRYNRSFKNGMIAIVICVLLFGSVLAFSVVAKIQYDALVSKMQTVEATVVEIDLDINIKRPDEQVICVAYEVDGAIYSRELDTDTSVAFAPGVGAHYSVGDKIDIFYDPQNPEVIAFPRSVSVGYFYMTFGAIGLLLMLGLLVHMLKHSREYLVTREEYEKEKESRKRSKSAKKKKRKA